MVRSNRFEWKNPKYYNMKKIYCKNRIIMDIHYLENIAPMKFGFML